MGHVRAGGHKTASDATWKSLWFRSGGMQQLPRGWTYSHVVQ